MSNTSPTCSCHNNHKRWIESELQSEIFRNTMAWKHHLANQRTKLCHDFFWCICATMKAGDNQQKTCKCSRLRASPVVLSMWPLQTYFSHPSLVIYFFPTPSIKLKLGLHIGGRLLIANHLDQSFWLANQKQQAAIRSYLLHFSLAGVRLCCAFYQPQQTMQKCCTKTISLSQTGMFWRFFIQF